MFLAFMSFAKKEIYWVSEGLIGEKLCYPSGKAREIFSGSAIYV